MMRVKLAVDMPEEIVDRAKKLGVSLSDLLSYGLRNHVAIHTIKGIDLALDEVKQGKVEQVTLAQLKKELRI
jgi:hypothetical protein